MCASFLVKRGDIGGGWALGRERVRVLAGGRTRLAKAYGLKEGQGVQGYLSDLECEGSGDGVLTGTQLRHVGGREAVLDVDFYVL